MRVRYAYAQRATKQAGAKNGAGMCLRVLRIRHGFSVEFRILPGAPIAIGVVPCSHQATAERNR